MDHARRRRGDERHTFRCVDASELVAEGERFDLVLMVDFLHHLPDEAAVSVLTTARELASGAVVSLEPVTEQRNRVGRWFIDHDRGEHMRPHADRCSLCSIAQDYGSRRTSRCASARSLRGQSVRRDPGPHSAGRLPFERMSAQPELGERLRALRRERGLSLAQVAQDTSISQSFLSLVETGRTDITIGRLIRLVAFYGVHLSDLLPPSPGQDPIVVRDGDGQHVLSPAEGIDVYLLTSETDGRMMMPVVAIFEPGGGLADYSEHEGEEIVHVLRGSIQAEIDGHEPIILRKHDTVHFRANRRHTYRNLGKSKAIVLAVVTPPTL